MDRKGVSLINSNTIIRDKTKKVNRKMAAAIVYAEKLNWSVFPLVPNGKNPLTKHGYKDASKDRGQIVEWWNKWPDANIGIPTGMINRFFVLDVDNRHNGHEELEAITDKYGPLPETIEAITGRRDGSRHILFKQSEPIQKGKLPGCDGIDLQADGAYIVAPPSVHPDSGKEYMWELSSRPFEVEMAEPMEWLLNIIRQPIKIEYQERKSSSHWADIMNGVGEGNRNQSAASLAGHLLRHYVDPLLVAEVMYLWNTKNNPPLAKDELDKVINSIAAKELTRRKGAKQ